MSRLLAAAEALLAQHDKLTVPEWEVALSVIRVKVEVLRAAVAEAKASHAYVSTACDHGLHERCRQFCAVDCECPCHVELFPIPAVAEAKQQGDRERLHDLELEHAAGCEFLDYILLQNFATPETAAAFSKWRDAHKSNCRAAMASAAPEGSSK